MERLDFHLWRKALDNWRASRGETSTSANWGVSNDEFHTFIHTSEPNSINWVPYDRGERFLLVEEHCIPRIMLLNSPHYVALIKACQIQDNLS
jgi:hypothetical protein